MKEHDSAIVSFLHATTNNRELNSKQLVSYSLRAQVIFPCFHIYDLIEWSLNLNLDELFRTHNVQCCDIS